MGNEIVNNCCDKSEENQIKKEEKEIPFLSSMSKKPLKEIQFEKEEIKKLSNIPITPKNVIRKIIGSPFELYNKINLIAVGAYGKVYKIQNKKTLKYRAMKVISKSQLKKNYTEELIENEIEVLKNINHPNIIKLYEVYHDDTNYYLINEYCSEGELCKFLIEFKKFPEVIVRKLMFQIFYAVGYLHSNGIIHGDLKLENLTVDCNTYDVNLNNEFQRNNSSTSETSFQEALSLNNNSANNSNNNSVISEGNINNDNNSNNYNSNDNNNNNNNNDNNNNNNNSNENNNNSEKNLDLFILQYLEKYDLKLIDFGCSKIFSKKKKEEKFFKDKIGTITYSAPEVIKNNYTEKCDIWSCGVIMYILLTGELPFNGITESDIKNKILRGRFCFYNRLFKNISFEAKDLIRQCFTYDPNQRLNYKEALNHQFFKNDLFENIYFNLYPEIENNIKEAINSLISFSNKSKFFQTVITYLTHNFISKEEETRLKIIFLSIDTDLDGKISKNELKAICNKLEINISEENLREIIKRVDFDNDGFIDYIEFLQSTINLNNLFTEDNLKCAFDNFDIQNDGTVSVLELEEILGFNNKTNRNVIFEFMKEINKTENDEFTFEEFKNILFNLLNESKAN